jgi:predicted  nucleic acid-binding Zn-ribbon protein
VNSLEIEIQSIRRNIDGLDKKITELQDEQQELSEAIRTHKKERERLERMVAQRRLKLTMQNQ